MHFFEPGPMKLLRGLALSVVLASGCDSQVPEPDTAEALEDGAVLALRYQLAVERDSTTVKLPEALVRELAVAIARVRASEHGDLVEGIHAFPSYMLRDVVMRVDTSAAWIAALRRGDELSGEPRVDRLLRTYALTLTEMDVYPEDQHASALLQSEKPLNPVALASRFASAPGVQLSTPNGVLTTGVSGDIHAERTPGGWMVTFFRGTNGYTATGLLPWICDFRISGGTVEYLGVR